MIVHTALGEVTAPTWRSVWRPQDYFQIRTWEFVAEMLLSRAAWLSFRWMVDPVPAVLISPGTGA